MHRDKATSARDEEGHRPSGNGQKRAVAVTRGSCRSRRRPSMSDKGTIASNSRTVACELYDVYINVYGIHTTVKPHVLDHLAHNSPCETNAVTGT